MSTSNEPLFPVAVLNAPPLNKDLIAYAKGVYNALLKNPSLPDPTPTLITFGENITAFEDSETKAATRAKGAAALRDAKKKRVKEDLSQLRAYVQRVVNRDMSPAEATAVIESAFMSVRKVRRYSKPELSVKNADVSGKVTIAAKAVAKEAAYSFEYSVDQSNWTPVPDTMRCQVEVSGLTSARVHYFRFRALTRAGRQDYSQVVRLLVH